MRLSPVSKKKGNQIQSSRLDLCVGLQGCWGCWLVEMPVEKFVELLVDTEMMLS